MTNNLTIIPDTTAVIIMHYQRDIFGGFPEEIQQGIIQKAATVLSEARNSEILIVHVVASFREGFPELSERNKFISLPLKRSTPLRSNFKVYIDSFFNLVVNKVAKMVEIINGKIIL